MDLSTNYLGLRLSNPLVAGASPLSRDLSSVRLLEDSGVAAVVLYSLFEEQIERESASLNHFEQLGTESFAESLSYVPGGIEFIRGPEEYLEHVSAAKQAVDIPVIASLNGHTMGGWVEYAKKIQEAGADALELNVYYVAADPNASSEEVEDRYLEVLRGVTSAVSIPVAMKLGPYFSSLAHFARRLDAAGADGLVLFNRFYQPDIDLEMLEVKPDLVFSANHEMRLPLRWLAILDPIVEASLAASTGVYGHKDVIKLMMAGADVVMLCAALLRGGPSVAREMLTGIEEWMHEHEYTSVQLMQGSMNQKACENPAAFERANYMKAVAS